MYDVQNENRFLQNTLYEDKASNFTQFLTDLQLMLYRKFQRRQTSATPHAASVASSVCSCSCYSDAGAVKEGL